MKIEDLKAGGYSGGVLVAAALESAGIRHTFGIPGTHNMELYDALTRDDALVEPVLVTDEQSAGFMADAYARSGGPIACANVVPGAGVTHVLSGVGEAYMDNVPLLLLTCGIRTDTGHKYQLHAVDQLAIAAPLCKATFHVARGEDIVPTLLKAVDIATSGCPGPVAVEIPANLYLTRQTYDPAPVTAYLAKRDAERRAAGEPDPAQVRAIADMLRASKQPILHLGLGAAESADLILPIAERLGAMVSTTFSGKGVFPETHPQWLWPGFGGTAPGPLRKIAGRADAVLILGARMGEVSTGSYGLKLPAESAQVDIDPDVIGANFPVKHGCVSDARRFVQALGQALGEPDPSRDAGRAKLVAQLAKAHAQVTVEQGKLGDTTRVHPSTLVRAIQKHFPPQTRYTTDSGKGTFQGIEHLRLNQPRHFLAPTDFSCMGYCVPAAIGAAFAHPGDPVVGLAGDGALLMTGLELITAAQHKLPIAIFVLNDGELGQIASFQRTLNNDAPCSVLPTYNLAALAAVGSVPYLRLTVDDDPDEVVNKALEIVQGGSPVLVDVLIDYSQKTYFTVGVVKTNLGRLSWNDRVHMVSRAVGRRVFK